MHIHPHPHLADLAEWLAWSLDQVQPDDQAAADGLRLAHSLVARHLADMICAHPPPLHHHTPQ